MSRVRSGVSEEPPGARGGAVAFWPLASPARFAPSSCRRDDILAVPETQTPHLDDSRMVRVPRVSTARQVWTPVGGSDSFLIGDEPLKHVHQQGSGLIPMAVARRVLR